jgi:hypothetical protein
MISRGHYSPRDTELLRRGLKGSVAGGSLKNTLDVANDFCNAQPGIRTSSKAKGAVFRTVRLNRGMADAIVRFVAAGRLAILGRIIRQHLPTAM